VIRTFEPRIQSSTVLKDLDLESGKYFLVTTHRAENVDIQERIESIVQALQEIADIYNLPVIVSTHPRTREKMKSFGIEPENDRVRFLEPFGFFGFIMLEKNARCILTDSGTVQEEAAILGIPSVTVRDVTERPETVECGSNILSGADKRTILHCVDVALNREGSWRAPPEYLIEYVSETVVNILIGYQPPSNYRFV
jgi:UDP-N-acetylglucosamine 2-epimerase (non-hydrolysing)